MLTSLHCWPHLLLSDDEMSAHELIAFPAGDEPLLVEDQWLGQAGSC